MQPAIPTQHLEWASHKLHHNRLQEILDCHQQAKMAQPDLLPMKILMGKCLPIKQVLSIAKMHLILHTSRKLMTYSPIRLTSGVWK